MKSRIWTKFNQGPKIKKREYYKNFFKKFSLIILIRFVKRTSENKLNRCN